MDRLLYLSKYGFRVFPCIRNKKTPMIDDWRNRATFNPMIKGNYGVLASGSPYGNGTIVVVDLDNHNEKEESGVEFWEKNNLPSDTFTVSTPSGGKHLYFVATPQDLESIKSIGGQKLHPQIDFFWEDNHYEMGVGSIIDGKTYEVINEKEPMALPEVVIELLREYNKSKGRGAAETAKKPCRMTLNGLTRQKLLEKVRQYASNPDNIADYEEYIRVIAALKNCGYQLEEVRDIFWDDSKTQGELEYKWNSFRDTASRKLGFTYLRNLCWPDYQQDLLAILEEKEAESLESINNMFPSLHKVIVGNGVYVIDENLEDKLPRDPKVIEQLYSGREYRVKYPFIVNNAIVEKIVDSFPLWFKNTEALERIVFRPSLPEGTCFESGVKVWNTYRKIEPENGEGTPDLFLQHLREDCSQTEEEYQYLLNWIFNLILYPEEKPETAICLSGKQGTGKSIIAQCLGYVFNDDYIRTIDNSEALTGRFDSHWKQSLLVVLEESTVASHRGIWPILKSLITSQTVFYEKKGVDPIRINNYMRFLLCSNDDFCCPKEQNDRRWFCLKVNDNHIQDAAFFGKMLSDMKNGGAKKLIEMAHEHAQEVKDFNFRNIPENTFSREQTLNSAPLLLQVLVSKLDEFNEESESFDDMPFYYNKTTGEVLITAERLKEIVSREKQLPYMTEQRIGRYLAEWLGVKSENRRVPIGLQTQVRKCFCFPSISATKSNISATYFCGKSPFTALD